MKKAIVLAMAMIFACGLAWADPPGEEMEEAVSHEIHKDVLDKCPTHGMVKDCTKCHTVPNFKIIEADPFEGRETHCAGEYIFWEGEVAGYVKVDSIIMSYVQTAFEYFDRQEDITTMIVEVDSYGGSMFDMWGIVGLIEDYYDRFHIITVCKSTAFSAGLPVFLAGEERLTSGHAQFMWHEVSYWSFLKKNFPSGIEEEAAMLRKWQDQGNEYIASRCNKASSEIHDKVSFREWWFNGSEAVEWGVAHAFIATTEESDSPTKTVLKTAESR